MKKLLAMVMVLGMASMASAALSLDLNGGTLDIVAAGGEADQYFVLTGAVSGGTMAGNLTADVTFFGPDALGTGMGGIEGFLGTPLTASGMDAGPVVTGIVYGGGVADLYQVWEDGSSELLDSVPEPITMSLLALGGLVALRRRRTA